MLRRGGVVDVWIDTPGDSDDGGRVLIKDCSLAGVVMRLTGTSRSIAEAVLFLHVGGDILEARL